MIINRDNIMALVDGLDEHEFHRALVFFDGDYDEIIRFCEMLIRAYEHCPELVNICTYAVGECC